MPESNKKKSFYAENLAAHVAGDPHTPTVHIWGVFNYTESHHLWFNVEEPIKAKEL